MIRILVDADACPVKEEVYKVADRHRLPVTLVSNSYFRFPRGGLIELQVVSDGFDAADDWIAENAAPTSIVVGFPRPGFRAAQVLDAKTQVQATPDKERRECTGRSPDIRRLHVAECFANAL